MGGAGRDGDPRGGLHQSATEVRRIRESAACGGELRHEAVGAGRGGRRQRTGGRREVGRQRVAGDIGLTGLHGDRAATIDRRATEIRGVHECAAARIELGHVGIGRAAVGGLLGPGRREVRRRRRAGDVGVAGSVDRDARDRVGARAAEQRPIGDDGVDHEGPSAVVVADAQADAVVAQQPEVDRDRTAVTVDDLVRHRTVLTQLAAGRRDVQALRGVDLQRARPVECKRDLPGVGAGPDDEVVLQGLAARVVLDVDAAVRLAVRHAVVAGNARDRPVAAKVVRHAGQARAGHGCGVRAGGEAHAHHVLARAAAAPAAGEGEHRFVIRQEERVAGSAGDVPRALVRLSVIAFEAQREPSMCSTARLQGAPRLSIRRSGARAALRGRAQHSESDGGDRRKREQRCGSHRQHVMCTPELGRRRMRCRCGDAGCAQHRQYPHTARTRREQNDIHFQSWVTRRTGRRRAWDGCDGCVQLGCGPCWQGSLPRSSLSARCCARAPAGPSQARWPRWRC